MKSERLFFGEFLPQKNVFRLFAIEREKLSAENKKMRIIRTRILIETEEIVWGRFPQKFTEEWCEKCGKRVRMANLSIAARIAGLDEKTFGFRVAAGEIHRSFRSREMPLFCLASLLAN
jgi:hypothetical protein